MLRDVGVMRASGADAGSSSALDRQGRLRARARAPAGVAARRRAGQRAGPARRAELDETLRTLHERYRCGDPHLLPGSALRVSLARRGIGTRERAIVEQGSLDHLRQAGHEAVAAFRRPPRRGVSCGARNAPSRRSSLASGRSRSSALVLFARRPCVPGSTGEYHTSFRAWPASTSGTRCATAVCASGRHRARDRLRAALDDSGPFPRAAPNTAYAPTPARHHATRVCSGSRISRSSLTAVAVPLLADGATVPSEDNLSVQDAMRRLAISLDRADSVFAASSA